MTEIKWIKGGTDNCYLVTDGTKAILVDTASRQNLDQVIAECDKYEMKLIVLTHVHFDHAENAAELSEGQAETRKGKTERTAGRERTV